ncbi:hypothetical protein LXL04_008182 [Taraxacum kok-saghyz]
MDGKPQDKSMTWDIELEPNHFMPGHSRVMSPHIIPSLGGSKLIRLSVTTVKIPIFLVNAIL